MDLNHEEVNANTRQPENIIKQREGGGLVGGRTT